MNLNFNKYAILIGIDDYKKDSQSTYKLSPLKGCVKDIKKIKEVLIDKCGFKEKNIYSIESTEEQTEIEIRNKIGLFLEEIRETFEDEQDSIYFQFSGHGVLHDEASYIMLHNSPIEVLKIPEIINKELIPKHQFYTFDCCHCGGEATYVRGTNNDNETLEKLLKKSSGIDILYACKKNQAALETENGGKLTNSIIKIISDSNYYDKDKVLSSGTLIEQVKKEMIDEKQEPIGCTQTNGYYPFAAKAFWKTKEAIEIKLEKEEEVKKNMIEKRDEEVKSIFSDSQNFDENRRTMSENILDLIERNFYYVLEEMEVKAKESSIPLSLLSKIYNSLDHIPLSSGIRKEVKERENINPLISSQINAIFAGKDGPKYEYRFGPDSFKFALNYSTSGEFSNTFKIRVVVLPLQFGISLTFILSSSCFGGGDESIELENIYLNVMSSDEFISKKEEINSYFNKKIIEIVNKNLEKDIQFNIMLKEEYNKFEASVTKF